MPSQRRLRVFGLLVALVILATLYLTTSARQTRNSQFYVRTSSALRGKRSTETDEDKKDNPLWDPNMSTRLKEAERLAKISALRKGRQLQEEVLAGMAGLEADGKSVAGRIHMSTEQENEVAKALRGQAPLHVAPSNILEKWVHKDEDEEEMDEKEVGIDQLYNRMLRQQPIVIFSKSYCPFSKKAKAILTDQYRIDPAPLIVELDEHHRGAELQDLLYEKTKRKTVPNIIVGGHSIGGGDDIQKLHEDGELIETIERWAGSKIFTAEFIEPEKEPTEFNG